MWGWGRVGRQQRWAGPVLAGAPLPPLLYADDMTLLATSAAGLQAQLDLLEQYCPEIGLTVSLDKTWVILLAGEEKESKALATVRAAHLKSAGGGLEATAKFTYPGVDFHCVDPIAMRGPQLQGRRRPGGLRWHVCGPRTLRAGATGLALIKAKAS